MSDSSEGIVSLPVPGPPGGGTPCEEVLGRRAPGADTGARSLPPDLAAPPPAALWAEDAAAACPSTAARAKGGGRRTAVTYVINEASQGPLLAAESGALQSLREACEAVGAALETLHFGKLDFGETAVLDRFYNAGERGCPAGAHHRRRGTRSTRARRRRPGFTAGRREQLRPPTPPGAEPPVPPRLPAAAAPPGWPRRVRGEAKVRQSPLLSPALMEKKLLCQQACCESALVTATSGLNVPWLFCLGVLTECRDADLY